MEEAKFNPREHLMNLKGKEYLQVMWRLVWFRAERPDWCIDTKLEQSSDKSAVFCAKIFDANGVQKASGYGSETVSDFRDYLEKAETKAIGRALAMLGYGTQFTADELDEGARIVDSPVQRAAAQQGGMTLKCEACSGDLPTTDGSGKALNMLAYQKRSREKFGAVLCPACAERRREARG